MTQAHDNSSIEDLLDLAVPYALHALSDDERNALESRVTAAGLVAANAFYDEVRAVRETMALVAAADAEEPPADLRGHLLKAVSGDNVRTLRPARRRTAWMSAAAAVAVGLVVVGTGVFLRPSTPETIGFLSVLTHSMKDFSSFFRGSFFFIGIFSFMILSAVCLNTAALWVT